MGRGNFDADVRLKSEVGEKPSLADDRRGK